jgi:hypothetical protein
MVQSTRDQRIGLFDEKIEIQIATQPDDFWSREDPQAVIERYCPKMAGMGRRQAERTAVHGYRECL